MSLEALALHDAANCLQLKQVSIFSFRFHSSYHQLSARIVLSEQLKAILAVDRLIERKVCAVLFSGGHLFAILVLCLLSSSLPFFHAIVEQRLLRIILIHNKLTRLLKTFRTFFYFSFISFNFE